MILNSLILSQAGTGGPQPKSKFEVTDTLFLMILHPFMCINTVHVLKSFVILLISPANPCMLIVLYGECLP